MKVKINVIKFETVNGKKVGKAFSFSVDAKQMAKHKTEATVKRKVEEYIAKSGVFRKDELKDLKYEMKDFFQEWKKEKSALSKALEVSTNNAESYYNECVGDKALEILGALDVKFLCGAIAGDMIGSVYEFASWWSS